MPYRNISLHVDVSSYPFLLLPGYLRIGLKRLALDFYSLIIYVDYLTRTDFAGGRASCKSTDKWCGRNSV